MFDNSTGRKAPKPEVDTLDPNKVLEDMMAGMNLNDYEMRRSKIKSARNFKAQIS